MIRIQVQPEPPEFHEKVRKPGLEFLAKCPNPTTKDFSNRDYWRKVLPNLYEAYNQICSYSCQWISPTPTGFRSVEHFKPKNKFPQLAYEWQNYRLVCGALNGCKGEHEDVLDPFEIQDGWFIIQFPSLLVQPNENLDKAKYKQVQKSINRLKLNDESVCIEGRLQWLKLYCELAAEASEIIAFKHIQRFAPFLAVEIERQHLRGKICKMLKSTNSN